MASLASRRAPVAPAGSRGRRIAGLTCAEVDDALPALLDGDPSELGADGERVARHVEQCLRCQAELARYRHLLRAVRTLREELVDAPSTALAGVLASIATAGERHAVRAALAGHRQAYVAGAAVGGAAAAVGIGLSVAVALQRRSRRPA